MFGNLSVIEKGLLSFDRDRMLHEASTKIKEEEIGDRLNDCEYEIKKMENHAHDIGSEYR